MSFRFTNNRILITAENGDTVLDTNHPMPHILQTAVVSTSVAFPATTQTYGHDHANFNFPVPYEECGMENVCGYVDSCGLNPQNIYTCTPVWTCNLGWVCHQKTGWVTETYCTSYSNLSAQEWEQVNNLLTVANKVTPDFVQVRVEVSRTRNGSDPFYGQFLAVLPAGQILAQGSTILESSFLPGGSAWLRRIMSIYVENGVVKVRFKSSNKQRSASTTSHGVVARSYSPPAAGFGFSDNVHGSHWGGNTASSFSCTFHITIGKFTS